MFITMFSFYRLMEEDKPFNDMFVHLVLGLQHSAWQALGKDMGPNMKAKTDLKVAKDYIDTLIMIKDKTKGNLNETEEGLLRNSLEQLQLGFVDATKKAT